MIRRPPSGSQLNGESQPAKSQLIDEEINDTDRILFCDVLIQGFRQERYLLPVITFNDTLHANLQTSTVIEGLTH